jgi:hypothetical protein
LAEQGLRLPQNIVDSIRLGWENEANFVENGFGLAALYDGELVVLVYGRCDGGRRL